LLQDILDTTPQCTQSCNMGISGINMFSPLCGTMLMNTERIIND
jgi:hypothetical protein